MRIFLYFFITIFLFFCNKTFSEEIKIIELHNQSIDQALVVSENTKSDNINIDNELEEENIDDSNLENENIQIENLENKDEVDSNDVISENEIVALPDFWEKANKNELLFLLDNMTSSNSNVLNEELINSLIKSSVPPNNFTEEEFNHIKITNLIKLGQKKEAFDMISTFNDDNKNLDFYNLFKLNYFFSTYEISRACDFRNSINQNNSKINKSFLLKVDIFCAFIQNKVEEADLLNSLLEDLTNSKNQDDYFQMIFLNLKNSENNKININFNKYDKDSMSLYSAMLRVGDMSLNENFLEHDSINLAMPIVLSKSSDIALRLKAAHKAYQQDQINAESIIALYQTVDFTYDELTNNDSFPTNLENNIAMDMAYLFQKSTIQLLPITKVQALVDFWDFSENNDLDLLAYDISRNLISTIEPSPELSEHSLKIAKANIHNENFDLADKWILFSETYNSDANDHKEKLQSIKLLYDLKTSNDDNQFINILLDSDIFKGLSTDNIKEDVLLTILAVINFDLYSQINETKSILDERPMPSRYLLNKIKNTAETNNYGELALSINISMKNKKWDEIHPEHLRIILVSLKNSQIENVFKNIILEILEESKII